MNKEKNEKEKKGKEVTKWDEPEIIEKDNRGPSPIPFGDAIQRRRAKAYRKRIQEETGLAGDLVSHGKAVGRLRDIDIELETDRLNRRRELLEAREKIISAQDELATTMSLSEKRKLIEKLKLDVEQAKLEAQLKDVDETESEIEGHKKKKIKDLEIKKLDREFKDQRILFNLSQDLKKKRDLFKLYEEEKAKIELEAGGGKPKDEWQSKEYLRYAEMLRNLEEEFEEIRDLDKDEEE